MRDYAKGIIYTIKSKDDLYVGSTTNFRQRKCCHKTAIKRGVVKLYKTIRANGGEWDMQPFKEFPCDSLIQLHIEEERVRCELNANLNMVACHLSEEDKIAYFKKWSVDNEYRCKVVHKEYYQNNKERLDGLNREYAKNNRDQVNKTSLSYAKRNRDMLSAKQRIYRAKKKAELNNNCIGDKNMKNVRGCYWNKNRKKWHAQICVNSKPKYLGQFDSEEEAHLAYLTAKEKLHPDW
tara:strand:+ start:96 stop:803 length:708 start_codon:yes stop_codon:yes gene_type:complete